MPRGHHPYGIEKLISKPNDKTTAVFMLNEWRIEPALNRLMCDKKVVQLEPRAMMVLLFLASKPQEVFSRSEIMTNVWAESIVNDEALTRIISLLRQAFDDDSKKPRFIETIYKRGYRLLATPCPVSSSSSPIDPISEMSASSKSKFIIPSIAVVTLALAIVLGVKYLGPKPTLTNDWHTNWTSSPLTSYPGAEYLPAISPDGSRVAFVMSETNSLPGRIWIREIGTEYTFVLPTKAGYPTILTWSPDGQKIAYVNFEEANSIRLVSLTEDDDQELYFSEFPVRGLAWSPDSEALAISILESDHGHSRIHLVHLDDNSIQRLTSAPETVGSDYFPVFSPNGLQLAFCRGQRNFYNRIHVLSLMDGTISVLEPELGRMTGLDWSADGQRLLLTTYPEDTGILQAFNFSTGQLQDMTTQASNVEGVSSARSKDLIVVAVVHDDIEIMSVDLSDPQNLNLNAVDFNSTKQDKNPVFSPDGQSIAFISLRSGQSEIWINGSSGNPPRRLSQFQGSDLANLIWSPDSKHLAITEITQGCTRVNVFDMEGNFSVISSEGCHDFAASWSADGAWLYVLSDRSGKEMTWRTRPDGSESEIVLPHGGIVLGDRASNGDLVFVQRRREGIWARNTLDGSEHLLISSTISHDWFRRHLKGDQIHFAENQEYSTILGSFDLEASTRNDLYELPAIGVLGFSLAPNGTFLVLALPKNLGSDLLLLDRPNTP